MPEMNLVPTIAEASPTDAYRRRLLQAQLLQKQAADASIPVYDKKLGYAKVAQGIAGGLLEGYADNREVADRSEGAKLASQWLDQEKAGAQPAPVAAPAPTQLGQARAAALMPPQSDRVYSQDEMNPMDAAVASPKELASGVNAPAKYAPLIGKAAIDNDIPASVLAAQTKQESGYNPNAVSSAGAQGISQFMPGTAKEMGINPLDPSQAIPAQGKYLRQQIDRFGGSLPLGLAAYNAGGGRVSDAGGDISKLPAETQNYVKTITGSGLPPQIASVDPNFAPQASSFAPEAPQARPQMMAQALAPQAPEGAAPVPDRQAMLAKMMANPYAMQMLMQRKVLEPTPIHVKEGETILGANYKPLYTSPPKNEDPAAVKEANFLRTATPEQVKAFNDAKKAGKPETNINIGGGSDKQIFDAFDERTKEARSAATGLTALRTARQSLQGDGGAITGFAADQKLALQKAGAALGVTDPKAIQNTETFRAAIAPQVASVLKSTVGTANISNSDREFAEKAAGGSITLDEGSINRLLDIMERASVARLDLHQKQLDAVYPDPEKNRKERALFGVEMPAQPQPASRAAQPAAPPDRSALETEARRRGLIK